MTAIRWTLLTEVSMTIPSKSSKPTYARDALFSFLTDFSRYTISWPKTVSSAAYIEDVDSDPILIVNGLTKNWRCPGFRVCWIVAPKAIVEMLGSAGSYLDGGANAPLQRLALPLMELDFIRKDAWALQAHFRKKRDFLLKHLAEMGISVRFQPTATFYIWANIEKLPPPLNDCIVFLEECIKRKVVCVPGVFFDINPRGICNIKRSRAISNVRFSYGPPFENLEKGMVQIKKMISQWEKSPIRSSIYADLKTQSGEWK
jgi:aspartate/methionine/tyrosine aminotransferase